MEKIYNDIEKVLLTKEQIAERIKELGAEITKKYDGEEVVVIGEKGKLGDAGKLPKNYSEKPLGILEPILLLIELRESGGETFCLCFPLFSLLSCIESSNRLLLCGRKSNLRG